jgi:CHAT domain-containing protein
LESALSTYTKAGNPKEAARVMALLGQVYDQQGVTARAKSYYDGALKDFTKLEDRVNEAAVYYALGRLALKQKDYDAATKYLRQSIDVTENMRRVSTSYDLTAAFSATVQDRYEAYIDCLMKKHQQQPAAGFAVKAFETSELGRVRALSERLNAIQTITTAGVDPQLAAQEKSLRLSLRAMENEKIKLLGKNSGDELKTLEEQIARLESNYKEISDKLRAQDPSFDEISKPTSWDLQQIRQQVLLDDDAVIVEFSLGSENSYAWTVTRDNMKSFQLPAQNVVSKAARQVYGLLSSEPSAETDKNLAQATAQLSDLVLKPVAAELNKQRIIVVADGALNYIPFQLLPLNSVDGQPLISRYEVVNVPSVSVLGQLRQERSKRPAPDQVLAAFGDPVFPADYAQRTGSNPSVLAAGIQPGALTTLHRALRDVEIAGDSFDLSAVQRLIYSERELANLRQISGPRSLIASGFDASREALEKTDLSHYAILHLATHAVFDPRRPEISGFLLSLVDRKGNPLDGFMTLEDVYRLQAPVDLVVLSACRTGLGKDVRGEGLIGLTRGFMHAGASSVAASLWNVDDEATSELMKFFYANMLQKRMTPAAALRDAQNAIRQQPRWRSPHFWAAFTLHGEYNETIRTRPASEFSRNMIIGTVALFVLALLSYWYLRRSKSAREVKTT